MRSSSSLRGRLLVWGLAVGLIGTAEAQAQVAQTVFSQFGSIPDLEHSNGDKIARGRGNTLHAVFTWAGVIWYRASNDGVTWSGPVAISLAAGQQPAIAIDGSGDIGVVWASPVGIEMAYKPWWVPNNQVPFWTVKTLSTQGSEPAIAAGAGRFHVSWTTGNSVRYTSFPLGVPPMLPPTETLASTQCSNTVFSRPSIALFQQDPCLTPRTPVVAYLQAVDEQFSSGSCQSWTTSIGPVVRQQQAPNVWPVTFSSLSTSSYYLSDVEALSLSLSADNRSRDVYVAWSDRQDWTTRTVFAKGRPGNFVTFPLSNTRRSVHVRAANDGYLPRGRFRLAQATANTTTPGTDFPTPTAFTLTGIWSAVQPFPFFTASTPLAGAGTGPGLAWVGRPQALVHSRRDSARNLQEATTYYRLLPSSWSNPERLVLHLPPPQPWSTPPVDLIACPPRGGGNPPALFAARTSSELGTAATWIDFEASATLGEISEDGLAIHTAEGEVVAVSWPAGTVLESAWGGGFVVDAPLSELTFEGPDAAFEVVDLGDLPTLESEPPTCDPDLGECP